MAVRDWRAMTPADFDTHAGTVQTVLVLPGADTRDPDLLALLTD